MSNPKILLAMIEAGGGHKSPALATKEAIEKYYPGRYQLQVSDFTYDVGAKKLDSEHKKMWQFMLSNPALTMTSYYIQDSMGGISRAVFKNWMKDFTEKGAEWLKKNPPDIFVSYHYMNTVVATEARKNYRLRFPIATYLTEPLDAHALWVWPETDIMIVSSAVAKYKLIERGFPGDKVVIVPYPIRPSFFNINRKKSEIREQLGVDKSRFTIMMSSGAEGKGRIGIYAKGVVKKGLPVNLLVVCGKNEQLKAELDELKKKNKGDTNLIPLGYVNNMNEILSVADIAAIKASPGSTFEALLLNKLVIHMQYVTPAEQKNTNYITENHIGWYTPTKAQFIKLISDIINKPELAEKYKNNLLNLNLNNGALELASIVDAIATGDFYKTNSYAG